MRFKMINDRNKDIAFLVIAFAILLLSFQVNYFGAASKEFFDRHQRDSESLVLGRIIETKKNGYLSSGGFLGRFGDHKDFGNFKDFINNQYEVYKSNLDPADNYISYRQSIGLQGYFYAFFDKMFSLMGVESGGTRLFLNKSLASSLLALLIILYAYFVKTNFGLLAAVVFTSLLAGSQWFVVFSNNLYWMFFLVIMPFVIVTTYLQSRTSITKKYHALYILVSLAVFLKSAAGYEYISTVLISAVTPLIYFAVRDRWAFKDFFTRFVMLGVAGLVGFFAAIIIHLVRLSTTLGGLSQGFGHLWYIIVKRTHGEPNAVHERYRASLESNIFEVILKYWNGRALNLESMFGFGGGLAFSDLIIALVIFNMIGIGLIHRRKEMRKFERSNIAISLMLWFSVLAPLSWHILAKGHSYIHVNMNHVLWYVPFLLLGFTYYGFIISLVVKLLCGVNARIMQMGILLLSILCAITLSANFFQNRIDTRRYIDSLSLLSELNSKSNLKVYYSENNLVYLSSDCSDSLDARFFLHIIPQNVDSLNRSKEYNFNNFDFNWKSKETYIHTPNKFKNKICIVIIELEDYVLKAIRTGQFNKTGQLWKDYIDLEGLSFQNEFTAFNLTDNNWKNGISRHRAGLFIANTFENRQSIYVGSKIRFPASGLRDVVEIQYSRNYINIFLSGDLLDPVRDGYPNKFVLEDMVNEG